MLFSRRFFGSWAQGLLCFVFSSTACNLAAADPSIEDEILDRYKQIILQESSPSAGQAMDFLETLDDDGRWPDLDYGVTGASGWDPDAHLKRVRLMALGLESPGISDSQRASIMGGIDLSVQDWAEHMYQSDNWWFNEIGEPQLARDVLVLLRDAASPATRETLLAIMAQYRIAGTAANLAWSAEIAFHYACFTEDRELLATAADRIWQEVTVGAPEGIQTDWSFYQHDERLMTWGYGRSFLDIMSKLAWQLRETEWEMPAEKRAIIEGFILDGAQWMQRGGYNSPAGLDRAVSRPRHMDEANMRSVLNLWSDVSSGRQDEIEALIDRQIGFGEPLQGMRVFPLGDFAAYHQPSAAIMLKTVSDRTLLTQSINDENLLGWPYLVCGDHYIISNGREYYDLPPVWDWSKLPGLTTPSGESTHVRRPFVGAVSDGVSGLVSMDYAREREDKIFEVRKLWAFHGGLMVCLLGGWNVDGDWNDLATSIEQCLVQENVEYSKDGVRGSIPEDAAATVMEAADWVLHNGIGYVPLNSAELRLRVGEQEGSWQQINKGRSADPVVLPVLNLQIAHGPSPATSGYIIVLDATADSLDELVNNRPFTILANRRSQQALQFADGLHFAAFYEPGAADGAGDLDLEVTQPVLAMWSSSGIWLADPTHAGGEAGVSLGGADLTLPLPAGGVTTSALANWHGYPASASGQVDTQGWIGWVNVTYDPWVWSFGVNRWLYMDGSGVFDQGAWAFVPN